MLESIVYVWNIESMRSNQQWIAQVASILTQEVQDEEWFFFHRAWIASNDML